MTDNEIIKALECCKTPECSNCAKCPQQGLGTDCLGELITATLDLINRQKAEIESLIAGQETLQKELPKVIKAEAVKEFAEIIVADYPEMEYYLDNIKKEMVGDTK